MGPIRWISLTAAIALAMGEGIGVAAAAGPVCTDLQVRLAALDSGNNQSAATYRSYDTAVNQQRAELDRATASARNAGCLGGFFFFQRRPDARCGQLMATINQMRANLSRLAAIRDQYAGDPNAVARQRNALLRQLALNQCGGNFASYGGGPGNRGLLATLFGQARIRTWGDGGFFNGNPYGTYRTLCVRACDGYYFPISFSTVPDRFAADEQTCQAMCPGQQVQLYFYRNPGEGPEQMVSTTGEPYTALPTAFRYRQQYDPGCTCGATRAGTVADLAAQAAALSMNGPPTPLAATVPTPVPVPAPTPGTDPETLANRAGDLSPAPVVPAEVSTAAGSPDSAGKKIRVVGPDYYVAE